MRHARAFGLAGLAVSAVAAVALAQPIVTPAPDAAPVQTAPLDAAAAAAELAKAKGGDPQAGATKAGACAACHGLDGNSTNAELYPRLAGQSERYVAHQLSLFKSGQRVNPIMQPFAAALSAQDMRDLGAYFATQASGAGIADDTAISDPKSPYKGMKFFEVGQKLYRGGDAARGIPAYPHVGGQQGWYTARRLQEYRTGETTVQDKALYNIMAAVAAPLTDEEIQALSSYMQGLHPRAAEAAGAKQGG